MNYARCLGAIAFAASVLIATTQGVSAKKSAATPAPSAAASGAATGSPNPSDTGSGAPAPLPTASEEPPQSAIPRLQAKVQANPSDRDSLGQLAAYYLQVGRPDLALGAAQHLIALGMKTTQVYYLDGISNRQLGRTKEAIDDFEQASNLEPTNPDILETLTSLYVDANRPDDAEREAKRATKFNPTDKKAFENLGAVYEAEKKYDDARTQYEAAAKIDPKDAGPVVLEASSYAHQDALALAGTLYDRALAIDPKYPDALLGKAHLLASEHNVKDAIATYETLIPLVPQDIGKAQLSVEEASLYQQEKMIPEADAQFKKSLATYPKVAAVYIAYGDFQASQKNIKDAQTEYETAASMDDKNTDAIQRLAVLYTDQNHPQQASDEFKKLTVLLPNDPSAWAEYAQSLAIRKQFEGARDAYRHSFEIDHTPAALAGLAATDFQLHNYRECGQVFDAITVKAAGYMQQNPGYYVLASNCYHGLNQNDKARSTLQTLLALTKPGSPQHAEVQHMIDQIKSQKASSGSSKPSPKATATPRAHH